VYARHLAGCRTPEPRPNALTGILSHTLARNCRPLSPTDYGDDTAGGLQYSI